MAAIIRVLPAILWMSLIFVLSAQDQRPGPEPRSVAVPQTPGSAAQPTEDLFNILGHLALYGVLAACLWWALWLTRLTSWGRLAITFGIAMLYGATDEWHQSHVANRQASQFDLLVNAAGALAAVVLIMIVLWTISRISPSPRR